MFPQVKIDVIPVEETGVKFHADQEIKFDDIPVNHLCPKDHTVDACMLHISYVPDLFLIDYLTIHDLCSDFIQTEITTEGIVALVYSRIKATVNPKRLFVQAYRTVKFISMTVDMGDKE